ncbi:hypothetical protein NW752_007605 [Fusarium irregulare]|uniref:Fucose-specific lectin n=1 Tax=Fusarium irregulare TaxID=2494466 RepID=A0A9W8PHZ5_9HYPO|nr:hypothetical protein NW766_010099 [Fusarium irregulare]KAJ4013308.1 hypothetical protein NW752_007605 [Fusarium irregulare]
MAPITALIDKSIHGDKVIKLFYCTGKAQLGLALWSATEDADPEDSIQPPTEVGEGQYITNPSQMTSINLQGEEKIVALTTENPFKVTDKDRRNLSEVSPYQKLSEVDIGHTTLTSCSSDDNAWIYFSGPLGNARSLFERQIGSSQSTQLIFSHDLWINSYAAAWYDTEAGKRKVIYEGSFVVEYTVGDQNPIAAVTSTGDMQRNSPLAVAFDKGTVYLYYCGRTTSGGIRRTKKVNGTWSTSVTIGSATIAQDSQLACVRANGINHLFYVARDEDESKDEYFVHYLDKD